MSAPMDDFLEHFRLPTTIRDQYTFHQMDKRGGRGVERWTRVRSIGRGAYGMVWLEKCSRSRETRAVKEVSKDVQMDHLREIRAIAKSSKHTDFFAKFFGWYDDQNSYFLAMEYIPHGSLFDHLKVKGVVPKKEAKEIVGQLLEGLSFMHANNYAHRDLKPGNIFVASPGPEWWVKIGDFGISKRVTEETALHTTGVYTQTYCAPEMRGFARDRCETDNYSYTSAVDMWSLGVITFEILTLKRPFPARNDLIAYYDGKQSFPTKHLFEASMSQHGIDFIAKLHQSRPGGRPTAVQALEASWLHPYRRGTIDDARSEDIPSEPSDADDEANWEAVPDRTSHADHEETVRPPSHRVPKCRSGMTDDCAQPPIAHEPPAEAPPIPAEPEAIPLQGEHKHESRSLASSPLGDAGQRRIRDISGNNSSSGDKGRPPLLNTRYSVLKYAPWRTSGSVRAAEEEEAKKAKKDEDHQRRRKALEDEWKRQRRLKRVEREERAERKVEEARKAEEALAKQQQEEDEEDARRQRHHEHKRHDREKERSSSAINPADLPPVPPEAFAPSPTMEAKELRQRGSGGEHHYPSAPRHRHTNSPKHPAATAAESSFPHQSKRNSIMLGLFGRHYTIAPIFSPKEKDRETRPRESSAATNAARSSAAPPAAATTHPRLHHSTRLPTSLRSLDHGVDVSDKRSSSVSATAAPFVPASPVEDLPERRL